MMYTLPEARRCGLSSYMLVKLAEQVFSMQDYVYGFVKPDNKPSVTLLKNIGYRFTCDLDWITFGPSVVKK